MKKFLYSSVLILLYCGNVAAQTQFQWVKAAGALGKHDHIKALGFDLQGNAFAAGTYHDSTRFDGTLLPVWPGVSAVGGSFLVKYDLNGNLLWAKSIRANSGSTAALCEVQAMAVTPAGEATVFGKFTDSLAIAGQTIVDPHGGFGENSSFMAKFDASGQLMWLKLLAAKKSSPVEARILANDDILLTGLFDESVSFGGSCALTAWSGLDNETFLARINGLDGSCVWAVKLDGKKENRVSGLEVNSDKAFITGVFRDSIRFNATTAFGVTSPEANAGNRRNLFVAAYNLQDGSFSWAKQIKGQLDWAADITVLSGRVILCGNATGYIKIGEDSSTAGAFVAGLQLSNGDQLWLKKSSKFVNKLVRAGSDGFYVLGNGNSGAWAIDTITTAHLGSGFMFAKFNAAGAALFAEGFGATGATIGIADAAYRDGDLLIGGSCYGFGTVNLGNNQSLVISEVAYNDLWFGLYGSPGASTAVKAVANPLVNVVLYPNPAQTGFSLQSELPGQIQYEIISFTGKKVLYGSSHSGEMIQTHTLAAGTYIVRLQQNHHFSSRKLVITP